MLQFDLKIDWGGAAPKLLTQKMADAVNKGLESGISAALEHLKTALLTQIPYVHGGFQKSIDIEGPFRTENETVGVIGARVPYALWQEIGFGGSGKWPPIAKIRDWARIRLGLGGEELERAGFLIARRIAYFKTRKMDHETRDQHYFRQLRDTHQERVQQTVNEHVKRSLTNLK